MAKFVIISDSCCDLNKELRAKYDIEYIKMNVYKGEEKIVCSLDWTPEEFAKYYNDMKEGVVFTTAQLEIPSYMDAFEKHLKEGRDIISISCSSALTGSINASFVARSQLLEKYPDAKIHCIDSLISLGGQSILAIKAAIMRDEGKSIDEVAEWLNANKLKVHQTATGETLTYLRRSGRVTGAAAFFGNILQVKPILISDVKGRNAVIVKVKGRKNSLAEILRRTREEIVNPEEQVIHITHADCLEDALYLKEEILKTIKCQGVVIGNVNPTVGATVGGGTVGTFYFGEEVTYDVDKSKAE